MELQKLISKPSVIGIFLIAVLCLFSGCSRGGYSEDIIKIKDKLDKIEKRLAEYEQQKEVQELKTKFNEEKAAIEERLKKIEEKYEKKPGKAAAATAPSPEKPTAPTKPTVAAKNQYHVVSNGETLYSISRKYKVPVSELCRLNNLKPTQHLQTGQKLLIAK